MKFEEMGIEENVLDSLSAIGFEKPTRIQLETIPIIKQGFDVIGQSETGSGKTAAFGIPLIEKVERNGKLQALVLAPTRELALQIEGDLRRFAQFKKLFIQAVYGGVSMSPQISGLRRAEIVVGTPGRVLDHMERGTLDASNLKIFVLDEADKMLDMGFVEDIQIIERHIPKNRQTLLFSATMPDTLEKIKEHFTRNAKKIRTEIQVREDLLKQFYCDIDQSSKFSLLVHLINKEKPKLGIIFCNSRREADSIAKNLQENGINATALHGGLTQNRREHIMQEFHRGIIEILVATDVAARGLDIKNVTHIFNFSIPRNIDDYANRIGRTARAGESGVAISLLSRDDHNLFRQILRTFSYNIEKMRVTDFKILPFRRYQYREQGNFRRNFGRRFSRGSYRR
ncbi:MAG TPA: DEAD/DEAH box helicase [archaeon]|nr:DEAD/DEAH box helicase [archaeon]